MTPFEEILRRRRDRRQPMDERLPDGRSVTDLIQDQSLLPPRPQANSDLPSIALPNAQRSITWDTGQRANQVPMPESARAPEDASRPRAVTFDQQTGRPNETYYRDRGDTAGLYNAYENWTPHGGKRGFKNALKSGLLVASQAVRSNPNDPVTAAIAGFGAGLGGGVASPNLLNRARRQEKLQQVGGELKNSLALQKEQAGIDAAQMVPITLENGEQVLVPAKSAAGLRSHQQEIGLRGDTLDARRNRWNQLGEHEAARDAQALYNSGAADDSAELRAEIARRLRLPPGTALPPRGLGNQVKLDDSGNYVVISPRSGAVTQTGVGSYETTKEGGRDRRAEAVQAGATERVRMQQAGANQRAGMRGTGSTRLPAAVQTRIAAGVGALEGAKTDLTQLDAQIKQLDDASKGRTKTPEEMEKITRLGRQRQQKVNEATRAAAELNALDPNNESGIGEGGYPYRKPRAAVQSDLDRPLYGTPSYAGRTMSRANLARYAKDKGLSVEEARKQVEAQGVRVQ